jgi:hypothetical protein
MPPHAQRRPTRAGCAKMIRFSVLNRLFSKEDFISFLENELKVSESNIENDDDFSSVDPGFASEADYLRYKFA